jgi:hypothetical protein
MEEKTAGMIDASSHPACARSGLLSSRVTSVTLFVAILFRGMTSIWETVVASSCVGWSARQPCTQGGKLWKHSLAERRPRSWPGRPGGRAFVLDMATCPLCHRRSLRLIAIIIHESVMTCFVRYLTLAFIPPPIAPAYCPQGLCAFDDAHDCCLIS